MLTAFKILFIFYSQFLSFIICAPPPTIEPEYQIVAKTSKAVSKYQDTNLSFRSLYESKETLQITNSTYTITYKEDYKIIEHNLILVPKNLPENSCFSSWGFTDSMELEEISSSCEIINNFSKKECITSQKIDDKNNKIIFYFKGQICDGDTLIINCKYNKMRKNKEILFKVENVLIPVINNALFCDYKYILPNGYIILGLENNILTKQSDTIFTFYGECPSETINDEIRYSPKKVSWMADIQISLECFPKCTSEVNFTFPRYYIGGKIKSDIYELSSFENEPYKEEDYIFEDTNYKIMIPAINKEKVGIKLHTIFTNSLTDKFKVYLPESSYEIDLSKIDQKIKDKAYEIIKEDSDKPNYYKIGKFVHSYITYDSNYKKRELSLIEIYNGKRGVCKHYTLLYNAMLNAIGIKTIYISGVGFQNNITSGDKDTYSHAWTAALIDGKWKELDATWGLFEGISSGHIMSNFYKSSINSSYISKRNEETSLNDYHIIKMVEIEGEYETIEKRILMGGICFGIFIILCFLFYHNRKKSKNKFHSELIEEVKNVSDNNNLNNIESGKKV